MRYLLTPHAVQRYQERVKPALDRAGAEDDLQRMLRVHGRPGEPPERMRRSGEDDPRERFIADHADACVWIGDGVWAMCERHGAGALRVLTVLTHGGISGEARKDRNRMRRDRRTRNRARARKATRNRRDGRADIGDEVA